ncbi:polyprenyl synthetase family protein [Patescibacteria group bacterium]|nr:polyprenyl synthetase family protein [Patescibacteria group bacterium]
MNYEEYFIPYSKKIDKLLNQFFSLEIKKSSKITPVGSDMWQKFEKFVKGGKRIRGGLVKLGYECFRKANGNKILPASAAVEIIHGSMLIHDDIIDQSILRHNIPTIHRQYVTLHQKHHQKGDLSHYGESMAIVVGIIGYFGAIKLFNKSTVNPNLKTKAFNQLASFLINTGYGEALDVDLAYRLKVVENDVIKIHTYKTSYYTFIGPLKIGGALAGAGENQLKKFEDYGTPIGIAYQLQDDILGIFGTEEKLGKPIGDDIKEGKNTLLYTRAIKNGNSQQKKRLKSLWGKKNISLKEIEEARTIIKKTGSLAYSQNLASQLVKKGRKVVPKITKNKNLQEVFLSLADFIIEREK